MILDNFIPFYNGDKCYLYYDTASKIIFKGYNEEFKPGISYYISITLTLSVCYGLNSILFKINNIYLNILIMLLGFLGACIATFKTIKFAINSLNKRMIKADFSQQDMDFYVIEGKKQFKVQQFIIYSFFILALVFSIFFVLFGNSFFMVFATILWFLFFLIVKWIKPFPKSRFYKQYDRGEIIL